MRLLGTYHWGLPRYLREIGSWITLTNQYQRREEDSTTKSVAIIMLLFHSARSVRCGLGASKTLGDTLVHHVASNDLKRSATVLVVTDKGILKSGLVRYIDVYYKWRHTIGLY